jgi:hypothetical protein
MDTVLRACSDQRNSEGIVDVSFPPDFFFSFGAVWDEGKTGTNSCGFS